jgi:hypothetical protein
MSRLAVLLALLAALVAALPRHRCDPGGEGEGGVVALLGTHAHDHHGEHADCGHDHGPAGCRDEGCPCDAPCCTDAPSDPVRAPTSLAVALPPFAGAPCGLAATAPSASAPVEIALGHAPVPRPPTETVVLLR